MDENKKRDEKGENYPTIVNTDIESAEDSGLKRYIREVNKFPILTKEEEYEYGKRVKNSGDKEAAKALVQSHLRLVVKIATKFRKYGLSIKDLVSEGNLGLIHAVKKFDPDKGFRFSTYAMWWIKAFMQEYILRSWSLVKIGTTAAQRKLFFNLKKIKKVIFNSERDLPLNNNQIKTIANILNVSESEVGEMDSRLNNNDISIDATIDSDSQQSLANNIESGGKSQEEYAIEKQQSNRGSKLIKKAFQALDERQKDVIFHRQLSENPLTLDELSKKYNISKERVRQIEVAAINKMRKEIKNEII